MSISSWRGRRENRIFLVDRRSQRKCTFSRRASKTTGRRSSGGTDGSCFRRIRQSWSGRQQVRKDSARCSAGGRGPFQMQVWIQDVDGAGPLRGVPLRGVPLRGVLLQGHRDQVMWCRLHLLQCDGFRWWMVLYIIGNFVSMRSMSVQTVWVRFLLGQPLVIQLTFPLHRF